MKKVGFILLLLLVFCSGVAVADSVNGSYKGRPVVKVTVQGKEIPAQDVPAQIVDDRTLVPLYYLQSMGYDLKWDANTYSVDIKPTQQAAGRRKLTSEEITKLGDRVGLLLAYNANGVPFSQGSGFVISKDGLLISAHHMLPDSAKMVFEDNGTSTFTKPDFDSLQADFFGITLGNLPENKGKTFPYLNYTTELPKIGERVYAIGYPGEHKTVTEGIVSQIEDGNGIKVIRSSAGIDHGSSGSPLLNEYGEVIGINVSLDGGTNLAGYAIPMGYVQKLIDSSK